jgi:hypothetical protein
MMISESALLLGLLQEKLAEGEVHFPHVERNYHQVNMGDHRK